MVRKLKHTEIGDIPVEWEIQTFEETFKILSNNTLSREKLNNRGGAVRNIHYGDILTQFSEVLKCNEVEIPYINDLSLLSSSAQLLQDGDLIIADTAEDETVGKATEIQGLGNGKLVAGLHTIPCRVKKGDFVPSWLGYYMNSHMYHDQIIPFITGIKVSSISKSAIAETLILVPPIKEQIEIVSALDTINREVRHIEQLRQKKTNIKYGILQKLLSPKEEDAEYVFDSIIKTASGGTPSRQIKRYYTGNIPWVTTSELTDGVLQNTKECITEEAISNSSAKIFPTNTVLMAMYGATIGKLAIIQKPMATNQACCAMICSEKVEHRWLFYKLLYLRPYLISLGCGAGQPNISQTIIKELIISIPSKEKQWEIANVMDDMTDEIKCLEEKLLKFEQIKKGMISDLISGKIRLV